MIIFSLNLRGIGGPSKISSLKHLLALVKLDMIFFQETLVDGEKAKKFFLQCCPLWNCVALDPNGRSSGLQSGWNPSSADLCVYGTTVGILLEGKIKDISRSVKFLNFYAPYKDRVFLETPGRLWFSERGKFNYGR